MNPKHLYTIQWSQPYATDRLRPYLRALQEQLEAAVEQWLEDGDFTEANIVIKRIKNAMDQK